MIGRENPRFLFGGFFSVALVLALVAALVVTGCSDDDAAAPASSSEARLVKVVGQHNIVRFSGNVYGVPHGIPIDWQKDDLNKVPGMIVGNSVEGVEKFINSLPPKNTSVPSSPNAILVKVIGRYNIVKFNDNVYGAPHGAAIDWDKDDLKKIDGMIVGSSVFGVQASVVGCLIGEKVSRFGSKVSGWFGGKKS